MPMVALAPPRFSTTNGCPRRCASCLASCLATMSVGPPGGNGTTMVTGRCGHVTSAAAAVLQKLTRVQPKSRAAADLRVLQKYMIVSSCDCGLHLRERAYDQPLLSRLV